MNSQEALVYVKYGSNGKIKKGTKKYNEWRLRSNEATKKCRNAKKTLVPKLKKILEEIEKEEVEVFKEAKRLKQELKKYDNIQEMCPEIIQLLQELERIHSNAN